MKELITIQKKLDAPKGQFNSFGNYKYRSCEDILAAVKPLLEETKCVLLLSDEIKELATPYHYETQETDNRTQKSSASSYDGVRVYVEATATLINSSGERISVKAYAREEVAKKGMDSSQITGSASSYARKYALNGLFAIDDVADADATNKHGKDEKPATTQAATKESKRTKISREQGKDFDTLLDEAADKLNEQLQFAKDDLASCQTKEDLKKVVAKYPMLRGNADFLAAGTARKKALGIQ